MDILLRLDGVIDLVVRSIESNPNDKKLELFRMSLVQFKVELSKSDVSKKLLSQFAGGLSRVLQESTWAETSLGDEILGFLGELREYRKQIEEGR